VDVAVWICFARIGVSLCVTLVLVNFVAESVEPWWVSVKDVSGVAGMFDGLA
jgi:hypothetical protein